MTTASGTMKRGTGNLYDDPSAMSAPRVSVRSAPYKRKRGLTDAQRKEVNKIAARKAKAPLELKYYENTQNLSSAIGTWQFTSISGTTITNVDTGRVGDEIMVRDIEFTYTLRLPVSYTTTNGQQFCRVILFQYGYDDTTMPPSGSIVFRSNTSGIAYISPPDHDRRNSIRILYDELVTLCINGNDAMSRRVIVKPWKKKLNYIGSSTGNGENQIYLAYCDDGSASSGNHVAITWYSRINYYDA